MIELTEKSCSLFPEMGPRHEAILRAALRLFNEKGYFSASVHEIVAATEVLSKKALYVYRAFFVECITSRVNFCISYSPMH